MNGIFYEDGDVKRMSGYATAGYQTTDGKETLIETTEDELSQVFEATDVYTLPGTDIPIDDAVQNPLSFTDYLVLDDGDIVFDDTYERDLEDE